MYAVIRAGGHQYKVTEGDVITVDSLSGEAGDAVAFDKVLMLGDGDEITVGAPFVASAKVDAVIREQKRAAKITVFKYKRRKNYKRTKGHKQPQTVIEVRGISAP